MNSARGFFGQPVGMSTLFFTEMWERFSFYGMRAFLVLFLSGAVATGGFGIDDADAKVIYAIYLSAVYLTSLGGGWIADHLTGGQKAIILGGIVIAAGHLLLGLSGQSHTVFYLGLTAIVIGTGLLKPNVAATVAQLYPDGGYRRDAGFTLYYMSVNLGGFVGPLIISLLAERVGWHIGFGAAAVGMVFGLVYFLRTRHRLGDIGARPAPPRPGTRAMNARAWGLGITLVTVAIVALLFSGAIPMDARSVLNSSTFVVVAFSVFYFGYMFFGRGFTPIERKRALLMLVLYFGCAQFWSGFEQGGSSFTLFADRFTDRALGSFLIPAGWFNPLNSIFIVLLAPVFSALWVQLGARNLDPSTPVKFSLALVFMALGFAILAAAAKFVAAGNLVGPGWLAMVYLVHTFGELCLSPVGLSAFSKLAPARLVGQSQGLWFMGTALGNLGSGLVAGEITEHNVAAIPGQLMSIFWYGMAGAVLMLVAGLLVNRWIAASKE
jgi:proton-dependent oligopeptide transporter, POT family